MASNLIEEEPDDTIKSELLPAPSDSAILAIQPYTAVSPATDETYANGNGVPTSEDGETHVQISLTTEDTRYKRIDSGILWIIKTLLGRNKPLRSPIFSG